MSEQEIKVCYFFIITYIFCFTLVFAFFSKKFNLFRKKQKKPLNVLGMIFIVSFSKIQSIKNVFSFTIIIRRVLTCPICKNQLEDPRLLQCLHSCCKKCLLSIFSPFFFLSFLFFSFN